MKCLVIAVLTSVVVLTMAHAQSASDAKLNALSFELGKTGLLYGLTFDRRLSIKNIGFRLGAATNFGRYLNAASFGGGGYYLAGQANHFLELGLDLQYLLVNEISDDQKAFAFVYPDYTVNAFYPSMNIGYRATGKWSLFRIGFSPGLIKKAFVPGGYISYGVRF